MASWARTALCSAIASAISRCVSIVSVLRMLPVVSTKRGIELFIIGINLGMTRFLLPIAIAVWNSISFCVWSLESKLGDIKCGRRPTSCSGQLAIAVRKAYDGLLEPAVG